MSLPVKCSLVIEGKPHRLSLSENLLDDSFQLTLSLPDPQSTGKLRYEHTFTRSSIESLTAKTPRPLRYEHFLHILRQTIECDSDDDDLDEPVHLDILTKSHIVQLCADASNPVRIVSNDSEQSPAAKRYVVLSIGSHNRVCYPLTLTFVSVYNASHGYSLPKPLQPSVPVTYSHSLDSLSQTVRELTALLQQSQIELREEREASQTLEHQLRDEMSLLSQKLFDSQSVNHLVQNQLKECQARLTQDVDSLHEQQARDCRAINDQRRHLQPVYGVSNDLDHIDSHRHVRHASSRTSDQNNSSNDMLVHRAYRTTLVLDDAYDVLDYMSSAQKASQVAAPVVATPAVKHSSHATAIAARLRLDTPTRLRALQVYLQSEKDKLMR